MRFRPIFLLLLAFAACAPHNPQFVLVQNGLEVTATIHRNSHNRNERLITIGLRDASSHEPISAAEIAVQPADGKAVTARKLADGSFEATLNEPPGSGGDIGVIVSANGRNVVFRLQRQ